MIAAAFSIRVTRRILFYFGCLLKQLSSLQSGFVEGFLLPQGRT
jgi:hypothetical protein